MLCAALDDSGGRGMELERDDPFDETLGFALAVRAGDAIHAAGMIGLDSADLSVPAC
jgi:hypothetical protein